MVVLYSSQTAAAKNRKTPYPMGSPIKCTILLICSSLMNENGLIASATCPWALQCRQSYQSHAATKLPEQAFLHRYQDRKTRLQTTALGSNSRVFPVVTYGQNISIHGQYWERRGGLHRKCSVRLPPALQTASRCTSNSACEPRACFVRVCSFSARGRAAISPDLTPTFLKGCARNKLSWRMWAELQYENWFIPPSRNWMAPHSANRRIMSTSPADFLIRS